MLKKLGIILTVIVIVVVSIFVYFNKNRSTEKISPIVDMKTISGTTYVESGTGQDQNNEWDSKVMRTGPAIHAATGVTVTVSTNGPSVRSMSADELREFQKKVQGN